MVKEKRKPFRTFANTMLAMAIIGASSLPIINYQTTKNVIAAEIGIPLDCPKPSEAVNGIYPFDAVAVLGAGMALQKDTGLYGPNTVTIPDQAIILETDSVNTASSLQVSKQQIEEHGWGNILYVSDEFHLEKRIPVIACEYGISGSYLSVEEIYEMYNPEGVQSLRKRNKGKGMAWRKFMEEVKLWSMIIDPNQQLQIKYKEWKFSE